MKHNKLLDGVLWSNESVSKLWNQYSRKVSTSDSSPKNTFFNSVYYLYSSFKSSSFISVKNISFQQVCQQKIKHSRLSRIMVKEKRLYSVERGSKGVASVAKSSLRWRVFWWHLTYTQQRDLSFVYCFAIFLDRCLFDCLKSVMNV